MKCNIAAFLSAFAVSQVSAFVTRADISGLPSLMKKSAVVKPVAALVAPSPSSLTSMKMATVEETGTDTEYDVVKVDLSDGRDYPIYIGAEFDDEEAGKILRSHIKGNRALLVTNDRLEPLYLEKYEKLLNEGGDIQIGKL